MFPVSIHWNLIQMFLSNYFPIRRPTSLQISPKFLRLNACSTRTELRRAILEIMKNGIEKTDFHLGDQVVNSGYETIYSANI